jgi:sugar lactone lactonase YvrE
MDIVHVLDSQNIIGEGPLWLEDEQVLYWVDIAGRSINRYWPSSEKRERFEVDEEIGVIASRRQGGFVVAGANGFSFWSPEDNQLTPIADPEDDRPDSRFNDGKVDRRGRFWAGTMTPEGAVSALYCLGPDLSLRRMDAGMTISNGIGWSPDNRVMYFADSMRYVIYAYDYDLETGAASNRRDWVKVSPDYGIPDGLTVDRDGYVWCAFYAGSKVTRFDPQGQIDLEVNLPVTQPTSCIFGGDDFSDLFVTSAWNGLSESERKAQPLAGDLFMIKTDVQGLPEPKFEG